MGLNFVDEISKLAKIDLFSRDPKTGQIATGLFVGRPFHLDYDHAHVLMADAWKQKAFGMPQGAFLLAYYENEHEVAEALLLRVLSPTSLPTDRDVVASMVEYYKDDLKTSGEGNQLDTYTRYEFSFSGIDCRVLGTFYQVANSPVQFGADVENFYSAHNYSVVKPNSAVLEAIVNFREGTGLPGNATDIRIGRVRYSSSKRFQAKEQEVPVYVSPADFLGKRTALFGMTRTGKSNTVKKIIQATVAMSGRAPAKLNQAKESPEEAVLTFSKDGLPKYPVGQIIFDINGEYANPNLQDEGTAIFELFRDDVIRYSTLQKPGFKVMKVNFYRDILSGLELVKSHLIAGSGNYIDSFRAIDLSRPDDYDTNRSAKVRHDRRVAAYQCCLFKAGFKAPSNHKVTFQGGADLNKLIREDGKLDPAKGLLLEEASDWWSGLWELYDSDDFFKKYKAKSGHEWADEDLKAILVFLTRKRSPGGQMNVDGFIRLRAIIGLHTETVDKPFEVDITDHLRGGQIVIIDLSQGNPEIQQLYSERICRHIFAECMERFISTKPNNFIQFYFEEAHNLFPKKEDKDLSQIYNRLAKEGAKLNLGLIYATQEVSSISSNILKNTQNWFIAHLNNEDETKEVRKYYDFGDFAESLVRFSASSDKGFVRMKTYSNPFVVPVQVDRFPKNVG